MIIWYYSLQCQGVCCIIHIGFFFPCVICLYYILNFVQTFSHTVYDIIDLLLPGSLAWRTWSTQNDLLLGCPTVILRLFFTVLLSRIRYYFFLGLFLLLVGVYPKRISSESTIEAKLSDCLHVWKYLFIFASHLVHDFALYSLLSGKSFSLSILKKKSSTLF